MPERSAAEEGFIHSKVDQALAEAGLPLDSPIRSIVTRDAEVSEGSGLSGQKSYTVKVVRDGQPDASIRERLEELRSDPMFRHNFGAAAQGKAVSSADLAALRENFADIAAGKVIVR